jgi:peptidoglycan/xylan/chitin deacetylase (PgdA/CDA1 family)
VSRAFLIFVWHNVRSTWGFPSDGDRGPIGMRRQFELLGRAANVVDLQDAVRALDGGPRLPSRAAVITFDDGYRDNLELAAPLLSGLGLPATFFLCPELLSGSIEPWWERLGRAFALSGTSRVEWDGGHLELDGPAGRISSFSRVSADVKRMDNTTRQSMLAELIARLEPPSGLDPAVPMMGWDEARQLVRLGFSVGSHSSRHAILANEPPSVQLSDLRQAKERLETGLGVDVGVLAYPNGTGADYNAATVEAAAAAGYRAAATTIPGWNTASTSRWELKRFVMYPEWGRKGFGIVPRQVVRSAKSRLRPGLP